MHNPLRSILPLFLLLIANTLSASMITWGCGDHLGSASWITDSHCAPIQYLHYLPYGEIIANQTPSSIYNERFKFTGKELDEESGYYYFGARYLLSELGNFISSDPLTDKYPHLSSYIYCNGNPIRFIDPDGRDIYRYDEETGDFHMMIKTEDNFDQVGQFTYNAESEQYELHKDINGNHIMWSNHLRNNDKIAKGILKNGRNFQQYGGGILVDGDGQPTTQDVQQFMLILDEIAGREISAYGLSSPYKQDGGIIFINPYSSNTTEISNNPIYKTSNYQLKAHFHTHGHAIDFFQATTPSKLDREAKKIISSSNPDVRFMILHNYGLPIHY